MPQIHNIVPVLRVVEITQAIGFYTTILGFDLLWQMPADGGGEHCMLKAGGAELMLSTGAHLGDRPAFTGTLYFNMDGVEAFFERVKDRVELVWPLELMDYGLREFGIRDLDGYTLAFAEQVGS